jgi:two-component system, response regulator YesN
MRVSNHSVDPGLFSLENQTTLDAAQNAFFVSLRLAMDNSLDGRLRTVLEIVESGTAFNIRDLALEVHLSPSHLQRLFRHHTGVPMGEWLNEQRLQRAANLLTNSYMSVKEIAHTVGYEHPSSFVRAFGRRFAQAPARYRHRATCAKC